MVKECSNCKHWQSGHCLELNDDTASDFKCGKWKCKFEILHD
jgi:hypothetical protein